MTHPVHDLIEKFGPTVRLAELLSTDEERFSAATISAWKHRKSIPVRYWPRLVRLAQRFRIKGVSNDALVDAHAQQAAA